MTLQAVAERAGVTLQTVLRRFGSKEGLATAVGEAMGTAIATEAAEAASRAYTAACEALAERVARGEVRCPRCQHGPSGFRYVSAPAPFFVCPACKRSFDPRDL